MPSIETAKPPVTSRSALLRVLKPPLPREHGTWAWLLVPALTGLFAITQPSLPAWLLFAASILGFFLRAAMESWRASRPRELRYLAWALLFGIGLHLAVVPPVTHWDRWVLLPLGAGIALGPLSVGAIRWLRVRRRVLSEAVVVASLSLLAPSVAYAGTGEFDMWTGFLWLPATLYLWGGITYVRLSLAPDTARSAGLRQERRRAAILYHAALIPALAAAVAGGAMPGLAALAYVPMMAKAAYRIWRNTSTVEVTKLGIWEVIHAGLFVGLLILFYRLSG